MMIRGVYLGYLNVFLAWQDQLLQAGSVFEEVVMVGTSEGCESCGGVQDRWRVVMLNWQKVFGCCCCYDEVSRSGQKVQLLG